MPKISGHILAIIPLQFVREALKIRDGFDHLLGERRGYKVARRCGSVAWGKMEALVNVHCGDMPLVGKSWIYTSLRLGSYSRICYVAQDHSLVFPG